MASSSSSSNPVLFSTLSLVYFFFFFVFSSSISKNKSLVSATREEDTELQRTHHRVPLSSLIPSSSCTFPPQDSKRNGSMDVVHKHGPCSKVKKPLSSSSSSSSSSFMVPHSEIFKQDEARVRAIQSKLSKTLQIHQEEAETGSNNKGPDRVQLPAKSGIPLGTGNYFVKVGLGSPFAATQAMTSVGIRDLSLVFDTGSDITWTQCKPCAGSCYAQKEPIFDPSQSSSYSNVSCSSSQCSQLVSATGVRPACSASTRACIYTIRYGDGSFSTGYFAKERLTLSSTDVVNDFLFGCGQKNQGLFRGVAGLLGLGRNSLSFVEQTAEKYQKIFSYCLPSTPSIVGYIAFGGRSSSRNVKFTPLSSISKGSSFYGLDFIGISVARLNLSISASVFSSGTIIDSGTVITRLPPAAYGPLRNEFRRQMSRYPKADPLGLLDTCYNLTGVEVVRIPTISFSFGGGVIVKLDVSGSVFVASKEQVCLAFAANEDERKVTIIGNTQQKTLEVVYDVAGERIGFRPRGCK
ncbi:aspartyl protease family protein At5g10770-like [Prosopis cineraria]|uniref:aspartyl protease family protein At5g10770-like n=1 Tax=Prosopis cineraria TaxID=364024 RepID=UPI002410237C|nr:aspartyl protease family protein At5g10770-like [Prosopis cineraria]